MHWFFALTEDSTAFREYADMIMVAVHTARKFTSLVSIAFTMEAIAISPSG